MIHESVTLENIWKIEKKKKNNNIFFIDELVHFLRL